jgi:hypothetical protein
MWMRLEKKSNLIQGNQEAKHPAPLDAGCFAYSILSRVPQVRQKRSPGPARLPQLWQ